MKCPVCNSAMKQGARFCSKCGSRFEEESEARPINCMEPSEPRSRDESVMRDARIYFSKGTTFWRQGSYGEAIAAYNELISRCKDSREKTVVEKVVQGMVNRGAALEKLKRREEAIEAYDEAVSRYGTTPGLGGFIARAYFRKSQILYGMEEFEGATKVLDKLLKRYGANPSPAVSEWTAKALLAKGRHLIGRENKVDEGIALLDEIAVEYAHFKEMEIAETVFNALCAKASALESVSKTDKAVSVYNHIILSFTGRKEPRIIKMLLDVIKNKAAGLSQSERYVEIMDSYNRFIAEYRGVQDVESLQCLLTAVIEKSKILDSMGAGRDGVADLNDAIAKHEKNTNKKIAALMQTVKEARKKLGK